MHVGVGVLGSGFQVGRYLERHLTADPFDLDAFTAANEKVHDLRAALGRKRAEIIPVLVGIMTAEERQEFLDWQRHRRRWRRRR